MGDVVRDADALTPCELYAGTWYKRDDLFVPYDDVPLSGGKVRQAIHLLGARADAIRAHHNGVVLTATGVHSPQGLIIARVAYEYRLRTVLFLGATTEASALAKHCMLRTASRYCATFDCSARVAYEAALTKAVERYQRERAPGYHVKFGINLRDAPRAIIGSTAEQAGNVPSSVRTVVVPVGAGITAAGILIGLRAYAPWVTRAVLVQVAGYDRRAEIDAVLRAHDVAPTYEWRSDKRYAYAREVRRRVARGFALDPIYEAKAHSYMTDVLRLSGEHVLFWCVGDSTAVRGVRARARVEQAPGPLGRGW